MRPTRARSAFAACALFAALLGGCARGGDDPPRAAAPPGGSGSADDRGSPDAAASGVAGAHAAQRARAAISFAAADFLKPAMEDDVIDPYRAPIFYVETDGGSPGGLGIGTVVRGPDGRPAVDAARPAVYVARGRIALAGGEREQRIFAWFRAGPDGAPSAQGLRSTLDASGRPEIHELVLGGSPERTIFVAGALEDRAREAFGAPLEGRAFSAEAALERAPDALVAGLFQPGPVPLGPFLYVGRDGPDVLALHCRCEPSRVGAIGATREYALLPLEDALAAGAEPPSWPEASALELALRVPPPDGPR